MQSDRRRFMATATLVALGAATGAAVWAQSPRVIPVMARKFIFIPDKID